MARFLYKPLGVLDRLYNLVGKQAPNQVDVESPIALVHDVSRDAGLSSGFGNQGGYFWLQDNTHVHVGNDRLFSVMTPWGYIAAGFMTEGRKPNMEDVWMWHISSFISTTDPTKVTEASIAVVLQAGQTGRTNDIYKPLQDVTTGWGDYGNEAHDDRVYLGLSEDQTASMRVDERPFYLPKDSTYTFHSKTSDGPCSFQFDIQGWVGPKGVPPPGMR